MWSKIGAGCVKILLMDDSLAIKEILTRSVENIIPSREEFEKALRSGKKLKIYLGVDATGQHLHLGHLTNLLWLRRMQDLGHKVIFLIGDFTGRIGDPTDKMTERERLTEKQIEKNMRTFKEQVSCIISLSGKNQAQIRFNSEWYKKMTFEKFMNLLGYFSVQNLLGRPSFKERIEGDRLGLLGFIYPLLQGYDGVVLDVDVEVGGNDQTFNMSIGRALRKAHSKKGTKPRTKEGEKFFVATTLLVNPKTDKKLMNKSEGGLINLDDSPQDIFGKVMALNDDSMLAVAEYCTRLPMERIEGLRRGIDSAQINPRDAKLEIATAVVEVIRGKREAEKAQRNWDTLFSKREMPEDIPLLAVDVKKTVSAVDVVIKSGVTKSKSEARRVITQGGFAVNGEVKTSPSEPLTLAVNDVLKIGKRRFFRIK